MAKNKNIKLTLNLLPKDAEGKDVGNVNISIVNGNDTMAFLDGTTEVQGLVNQESGEKSLVLKHPGDQGTKIRTVANEERGGGIVREFTLIYNSNNGIEVLRDEDTKNTVYYRDLNKDLVVTRRKDASSEETVDCSVWYKAFSNYSLPEEKRTVYIRPTTRGQASSSGKDVYSFGTFEEQTSELENIPTKDIFVWREFFDAANECNQLNSILGRKTVLNLYNPNGIGASDWFLNYSTAVSSYSINISGNASSSSNYKINLSALKTKIENSNASYVTSWITIIVDLDNSRNPVQYQIKYRPMEKVGEIKKDFI